MQSIEITQPSKNIIPFPVTFKAPPPQEDNHFGIGNRVTIKTTGETGVVTDGRPNFGIEKQWVYYVLITSGASAGNIRAAFEACLTHTEHKNA